MRRKLLTEKSHHSWPCAAFAQTEEYAQYVDLFRTGAHGDQAGQDTPYYFQSGEPITWTHVGEYNLGGNEHDAVCDIEICCESTDNQRIFNKAKKTT